MKIRMGFVTNSSSSSFILTFKSKHHVMEDLVNDPVTNPMAAVIYTRIMNEGKKLSRKDLKAKLQFGYQTIAEYDAFFRSMRNGGSWSDTELTEEELAEVEAKVEADMAKVPEGTFVVSLEVSDHDEDGSILENSVLPYAKNLVTYFNNH